MLNIIREEVKVMYVVGALGAGAMALLGYHVILKLLVKDPGECR